MVSGMDHSASDQSLLTLAAAFSEYALGLKNKVTDKVLDEVCGFPK
jgi:hypothetical protein